MSEHKIDIQLQIITLNFGFTLWPNQKKNCRASQSNQLFRCVLEV